MNVAAAADRRRVAEVLSDLFHGTHDRLLALAFSLEVAEPLQCLRRQLRAGPSAEIFGCNVLPGYLPQIGINLLRADDVLIALLIEILKQLIAGQVAATFDDAGQPAVVDVALVAVAALAAEAEMDVA